MHVWLVYRNIIKQCLTLWYSIKYYTEAVLISLKMCVFVVFFLSRGVAVIIIIILLLLLLLALLLLLLLSIFFCHIARIAYLFLSLYPGYCFVWSKQGRWQSKRHERKLCPESWSSSSSSKSMSTRVLMSVQTQQDKHWRYGKKAVKRKEGKTANGRPQI